MARPSLSFVIPLYNEAENIARTVASVTALAAGLADDYEIVLADDASTDGSADLVAKLAAADPHLVPVRLERNTKFGGALAAGLARSTKEVVIYTDADLPVEDHDVRGALKLIGKADVVTAYSLALKDASIRRIVISKVYNVLVQTLFGLNLRDINSGFKIYRRRAIEGLRPRSKSPFIDVELFAEAVKRRCTIEQYGLIFRLRTRGVSTISRPGVIARTFYDMLAYRFRR